MADQIDLTTEPRTSVTEIVCRPGFQSSQYISTINYAFREKDDLTPGKGQQRNKAT